MLQPLWQIFLRPLEAVVYIGRAIGDVLLNIRYLRHCPPIVTTIASISCTPTYVVIRIASCAIELISVGPIPLIWRSTVVNIPVGCHHSAYGRLRRTASYIGDPN